jgi:hypothetical protein
MNLPPDLKHPRKVEDIKLVEHVPKPQVTKIETRQYVKEEEEKGDQEDEVIQVKEDNEEEV